MKNIVLIGFMGTGKSTIGKILSKRLRRPFIDVDRRIAEDCKMTIPEIFQEYGEAYFRQKEQEVIGKIARHTNSVIATGGGVVLNEVNCQRLKATGIIIALTADLDVIVERTGRRPSVRPLLSGEDRETKIAALMDERKEAYANAYAFADLQIDTSKSSPIAVVDQIIFFLRQGGYLRGRGPS